MSEYQVSFTVEDEGLSAEAVDALYIPDTDNVVDGQVEEV